MKILRKPEFLFLVLSLISLVTIAQVEEIWTTISGELTRVLGQAPVAAHRLERVESTETQDFWGIAKIMFQIQMAQYIKGKEEQPETNIAVRDAHAKGHGCVVANFKVENDLPSWAKNGLFAQPGREYQSIIRFSNGTQQVGVADREKDARGMAIKILNADQLNLIGTGKSNDFLLINRDRFFIRNVNDYLAFQMSIAKTKGIQAFVLQRAIHEALGEDLKSELVAQIMQLVGELQGGSQEAAAKITALITPQGAQKLLQKLGDVKQGKAPLELTIISALGAEIESSLGESYFSMAAYLLKAANGAEDTAVKYITKPIECETSSTPATNISHEDDNFLRTDLVTRAAAGDHCFAFYLQPVPDVDLESKRTLVEDSRLRFATEPVRVATIRIPQQDIASDNKAKYCENMSFNPWQAQAEHQPLGSMNRARRFAVTASSIRRHLLNGVERKEPLSTLEYEAIR